MKPHVKNRFHLPLLIAALASVLAGQVTAQTFTTLHSFTADPFHTNSDGVVPQAGLILSGNTLYGTATDGGSSDNGTVFKVNIDGTGFAILHRFTATSGSASTNSDGANPHGDLILSSNTLYGTTSLGGSYGNGTLFAVNTDGTVFTVLHSFTAWNTNSVGIYTNTDGASPQGGLILSQTALYGTAPEGGVSGQGTVFAVNGDGTGVTTLHNFTATSGSASTNSDGANPYAGLILSGNILYGTAESGGSYGNGTVFAVHTHGTGFTNLHIFTGTE